MEALLKLRDEMSPALAKASAGLDAFSDKVSKAGAGLVPLSAGIAAIGAGSAMMATQLNKEMANVATLMDEKVSFSMKTANERAIEMRESVQNMAVSMGKDTSDIAAGLQTVIGTMEEGPETMKQLEIAAKMGAAGLADTTSAFNLLAGVTAVYGDKSAAAFQKTSDLMFQIANYGVTTIPQLSSSLSSVTPIAAQLGISMEELGAQMIVSTRAGVSTGETVTRMSSAMVALMSPSKDMSAAFKELGFASGEAMIKSLGFTESLRTLKKYSDESGVALMDLTGRKEGMLHAMTLAGSAGKDFNLMLERMKDVAGSTDNAFARQTQGINAAGFAWEQFKSRLQKLAQDLGNVLIPALVELGKLLVPLVGIAEEAVKWFGSLSPTVKTVAVAFGVLVAAAAPFLLFLGSLASVGAVALTGIGMLGNGLSALITVLGLAGKAIGAFLTGLGGMVIPLAVVAAGVATLISGLSRLADEIDETYKALEKTQAATIKMDMLTRANNEQNELAAALLKDVNDAMAAGIPVNETIRKQIEGLTAATVKVSEVKDRLKVVDEALGKSVAKTGAATKVLTEEQKKNAKAQQELAEQYRKFKELEVWTDLVAAGEAATEYTKALKDLAAMQKAATGEMSPLAEAASKLTKEQSEAWVKVELAAREAADAQWEAAHQMIDPMKKAKTETIDFANVLDVVRNAFDILGVSADSTFGRMVTALTATLGITKQLSPIFEDVAKRQKMAAEGSADFGKSQWGMMDKTQKAQVALAGLNTALLAYKSGVAGGAVAGATFGAQFGVMGAAIGAAAGALFGWIGKAAKAREEARKVAAEITKMRTAFISAQGGLTSLQAKAASVGMTLDKVFNAKTVKDYEDAVNELQDAFDRQKEAQDGLSAAMDKYGISIEQLGPKFRQQKLDEMAMDLYKDYELLIAAGVDMTLVIEKMGPAFQEYVNKVIAGGGTIPEALRPVIEKMIEMGLLLDENGEKITDISKIKFAESMTESVKSLIESIKDLIAALNGIPRNVNSTVTTTYRTEGDPGGREDPGGIPLAKGFSGWVTKPTRFVVGEAGPEFMQVTPKDKMNTGVKESDIGASAAAPSGEGGDSVFHFNIMLPGEPVLKFVQKASKNRQLLIHTDSVKKF